MSYPRPINNREKSVKDNLYFNVRKNVKKSVRKARKKGFFSCENEGKLRKRN